MSLNPDKLSYHKGAVGNTLSVSDFASLEDKIRGREIHCMDELPRDYLNKWRSGLQESDEAHTPPSISIITAPRSIGKSNLREAILEAMRRCNETVVQPAPRHLVVNSSTLGALKSFHLTKPKEKQMSRFNVETLMALANINDSDEFSKYDQLPTNLQEVLKRKLKEQEEKQLEEAADSIVYVLTQAEQAITSRVSQIRQLRREVERVKNEIAQIERSKSFGLETQNFVPLAAGLGLVSFMAKGAQAIPADWEAKVVKKTAVKK